jgi:DNA invertase Pin-like site-specific DNA recombinase
MAGRLAAMLDYARASDTVVVTAIDRLGRSVAEVTRTIADLGERRILLRALREGIDTATPTGRAVAGIMATLAELELELGRERRAASRQSRRVRGLPATKPPSSVDSAKNSCGAWRRPVSLYARSPKLSVSGGTAYRYLSQRKSAASPLLIRVTPAACLHSRIVLLGLAEQSGNP